MSTLRDNVVEGVVRGRGLRADLYVLLNGIGGPSVSSTTYAHLSAALAYLDAAMTSLSAALRELGPPPLAPTAPREGWPNE